MLLFESYPKQGRDLIGAFVGSNCRQGYGLKFMKETGQTCCAYCGLDFTKYENWLQMALDHVVPVSVCKGMSNPDIEKWMNDGSNRVLACATCNGFDNHYQPVSQEYPRSLEDFYDLRDRVFVERKKRIKERIEKERHFFETKVRSSWGTLIDK